MFEVILDTIPVITAMWLNIINIQFRINYDYS